MWQCLPVLDPQARPCRTSRWRWLVVGGYAVGLFALSSAPGSRLLLAAENRLVRRQRWALPRWLLRDKVLHTLAFGLGTVLLCRALHCQAPRRSPRQIAFCSVLTALGYGIADELHQACVPQRTAEVADVVADGLGAALAAWGWLYGASSLAMAPLGEARHSCAPHGSILPNTAPLCDASAVAVPALPCSTA